MYHLMTGKLPFPGESPIERLGKRIGGSHTPITEHLPEMPSQLCPSADKLLAHKPHERFATAAEAAVALQNLIRPKGGPAAVRIGRCRRRRRSSPELKTLFSAPSTPAMIEIQPAYPRWLELAARFTGTPAQERLASLVW